ncbi:magnesium-dependent phosphatase-1 [Dipodascopsis uninucleata]
MTVDKEPRYPKVVVFDLDFTLWREFPCWCDTHITPPVKGTDGSAIVDRRGKEMAFYPEVPTVISRLKEKGITLAAASRTHLPELARRMLQLLHIDGRPAIEMFDVLEIYPGSKISHFTMIRDKTKIDYSEMLFFDDESRNKEVEYRLGVKFIHVRDGVSQRVFDQAITDWRRHRQDNASK